MSHTSPAEARSSCISGKHGLKAIDHTGDGRTAGLATHQSQGVPQTLETQDLPAPGARPAHPGLPGCRVAFDPVVRFVIGCRCCIFTVTGHARRFALVVSRAGSVPAAQFAALVQAVFPVVSGGC